MEKISPPQIAGTRPPILDPRKKPIHMNFFSISLRSAPTAYRQGVV
jgi:hypothetical protein